MPRFMISHLLRVLGGGVFALSCASCGQQHSSSGSTPVDKAASMACVEMSADSKAQLVANIAKVNLGDSKALVESILGVPDIREDLTNKQATHIYGATSYYVVKSCAGKGRVKYGDTFVRLYYHASGDLFAIEAIGVDGIEHRTTLPPPSKGE